MKQSFIFLLIILFAASYGSKLYASEKHIINIAKPSQAYPPYHWTENGQVVGLIPDIIAATTKELGNVHVNYIITPWKRMFEQARSGEINAIMPINLNTERQSFLEFVEEPLIYERLNFITTTKFNIAYTGDLKALSGYDVAGIAGYYYGEEFSKNGFNLIDLPNEETQIKMLLAGRFPLALLDTNILPFYLEKLKDDKNLEIKVLEPHLYQAPLYLAFSQKSKNKNLASQFSAALKKIKMTGVYKNILKKHHIK